MGEKRGMKALEMWCKRVTAGYPGVRIDNMTTSWRDGLAFCALIHHFRPDLIDFNSLNKDDIYHNNELAFRTAELHLGIPALLDAEDMVEYEVPDRLSILTYLSQFYQAFAGSQQNSPLGRSVNKRPLSTPEKVVVAESPPSKVAVRAASWRGREPCVGCGMPVFLAERLIVDKRLFHRSCFRCARCHNQMSVANCYETEGGSYCCETCPDEVLAVDGVRIPDTPPTESSDESVMAEEEANDTPSKSSVHLPPTHVKDTGARANFLSRLVDADVSSSAEKNQASNSSVSESSLSPAVDELQTRTSDTKSGTADFTVDSVSKVGDSGETETKITEGSSERTAGSDLKYSESDITKNNSTVKSEVSQPLTAVELHKDLPQENRKADSKNTKESDTLSPSSLVKMRLKMFENGESSKASKTDVNKKYANYRKNSEEEKESKTEENLRTLNCEVSPALSSNNLPLNDDRVDKKLDKLKTIECENNSKQVPVHTSVKPTLPVEGKSEHSEVPLEMYSPLSNLKDTSDTSDISVLSTQPEDSNLDNKPSSISDSRNIVTSPETAVTVADLPAQTEVTNLSDYPEELNPFGDSDDESESKSQIKTSTPVNKQKYINPFESSDDDNELKHSENIVGGNKKNPPRVDTKLDSPKDKRRLIKAPDFSLNPFSDDDDDEVTSEEEIPPSVREQAAKTPVPLPRNLKTLSTPEPLPRKTAGRKDTISGNSDRYDSNTSLSSVGGSGTPVGSVPRRKKKPAPQPPSAQELFPPVSAGSSRASSPTLSVTLSPRSARKQRKSRPAPPPPLPSSLPPNATPGAEWEKTEKEAANRNRQSQTSITLDSTSLTDQSPSAPNKSTFGQWKRKKGPAPPRPVPQRRQIKSMPMLEVKRELEDIEVKQQELERQGVKLEKTIRDKFEMTATEEEASMTPDVEDLVLQLFELVNEKNELFRRQAELMYLRRQQRLEEEHADLEYQIRCLLERPEHTKTDSDKAREEELIQRLVEVVERRNEIVECLEMDRIREAEEDQSIHTQLGIFAAKNKAANEKKVISTVKAETKVIKKDKKLKKLKEKALHKKATKAPIDADKDIDEAEVLAENTKEKKTKKKWFI
ncbi:MICAL-like protein 1 [Schistocerca americana]|uniref:MICAL-like protein 1 n=1 Tax=Schistocerca americana TaxID=7009 RepID=UPI001F501E46|nr:MICAL-like protein 1 [Schistocerca americana]